jgi:hypothetical protein
VRYGFNETSISHHALGRAVVVVGNAVFVLNDLAVQFVDQFIDCSIQIFV